MVGRRVGIRGVELRTGCLTQEIVEIVNSGAVHFGKVIWTWR